MRGTFVAAAVLLHAAALALLPARPREPLTPPPAETDPEIAIDDGAVDGVPADPADPAPAAAREPRASTDHAARAPRADPLAPPRPPPDTQAPESGDTPGPVASARSYSLAELGIAGSPGLVGSSRFLGGDGFPSAGAGGAPDVVPRAPSRDDEIARRAERAIKEPLARRDQELGLGPDGPVLVALRDATYAGTTSVNGRAVLRATADGDGVVTSVEVLDVSADRTAWEAIAAAVTRALRNKPLRVSKRSRGVAMRIEVISRWQLPSGHDPGTGLDVLGIPLVKGDGPKSTKVQLLNPKTGAIFGVDVDPADIGAHARRLVTAHVIDEAAL